MPECEEEVQQIKNSIAAAISSGKRKKKSAVGKYFAPRTSHVTPQFPGVPLTIRQLAKFLF